MKRLILAVLLGWSVCSAGHITIESIPTLAPNRYGSSYWNDWVSNTISGLASGASSYGNPALPSYFEAISSAPASWAIVTGFPSWNGSATPGSFGAQYANELGRRITFALRIVGDGQQQFSISQLSFSGFSDDPANALGFSFGNVYAYSSEYRGLNYGTDRIRGTSDDFWVTGGSATQLVDAIFGRGSGSSFAAYCANVATCPSGPQASLDEAAAYSPYVFTGTYTLDGVGQGAGSFTALSDVPEPGTWASALGALTGVIFLRRRRR